MVDFLADDSILVVFAVIGVAAALGAIKARTGGRQVVRSTGNPGVEHDRQWVRVALVVAHRAQARFTYSPVRSIPMV